MSATRRSWEFGDVCVAIRTSFPGCPPDRWSHGTFGVELEDAVEDEAQDHAGFGDDAELEPKLSLSWEHWNPQKKVTQSKFLRPGNRHTMKAWTKDGGTSQVFFERNGPQP